MSRRVSSSAHLVMGCLVVRGANYTNYCVCDFGGVAKGLETLDSARQLYQRAEFATLRLSFLRTLFTTLLRRSHSLLQDEIIVAIHSIVSVVRTGTSKHQQST